MKLTEQKHKPLNKEKYTCNYSNTHRLMAIGDIHQQLFLKLLQLTFFFLH